MLKRTIIELIIIIFFLSLVYSLIGLTFNIFSLSKEYKYLETFKNKTIGTVKEVKEYHGSPERYTSNLTIDYEIEGKEYSLSERYKSLENLKFNAEEQITVVYDKDNPNYCIPESIYEWQKDNIKLTKTACAYNIIKILLIIAVASYIVKNYIINKIKI